MLLAFGEKPPGGEVERADPAHVGRLTAQGNVPDALRFGAYLPEREHLRADRYAAPAAFFERVPVVEGEVAVLARPEDFLEVHGRQRQLGDLKDVCAEVGDLRFDVPVGALNERH